ncbi:MAG TPA: maltotransferase domain-containing protein, partial [Thermoanaerobaculia bacterium]|nr:maltotransferase domain-containing protein [Thermoanaerobaculia bacterium]
MELKAPPVAAESGAEEARRLPSETTRVAIENVQPEIDCGRFAIKRVVGDIVSVEADIFADGHDRVAAELLHRAEGQAWSAVRMKPIGNDRFRGSFRVETLGRHFYTVRAWIDRFGTWAEDLKKRLRAGQNVEVDLRIGASLVSHAAARAGSEASRLAPFARSLEQADDAARSL